MTEPIGEKIGVVNQGTVYNQTNNITIHEGQKVALIHSDPVPDLRLFQGRETELFELNSWLVNREISIASVRGEGGIGKSTLTAKVFAECLGFAGKFWADVRTGTSITALAERALQEFGVLPEQVKAIEEKDLIPRLLRLLQQGRYLLAIDNLESMLTTAGNWQSGYASFFEGFQNLGSESVLLLASREYPPKYFGWRRSRWLMLEQGLEPLEGAAMLKDLEVEDTDENRAEVSEQVQGNPLALTLIAGWLCEEYRPGERQVNHLSQYTDLLQLEGKHRGEAQVSVDRVLQWSIDRLTQKKQHLLTQVSVLRGAFSAEVAAALVTETIKPFVSDADLDDLDRRSLLQALPERNQQGQRMFRLQPRIQEFVQKRANDLTSARERAVTYFWNHRKAEFSRDDTQEAVTEYEETFYHKCQLGHYHDAFATVRACDYFLRRRGYYQKLVNLYSQVYADWQPTLDQRQNYAGVCLSLGNVYFFTGQFKRAITYIEQSLSINIEIENRNGEAKSLNDLGDTYQSLGQYQRAIVCHEKALAISQEIGNREEEAFCLNNLGTAYDFIEDYDQGISCLEQALAIEQEIRNYRGEANCLMNLGNIYRDLGQYHRAIDFHQQSLKIMRKLGDRNGEAKALGNLGNAYNSLGQCQEAIDLHQQSLEIKRQIGDRDGRATSLTGLGNAYNSLGQCQEAIDCHQQSLKIRREIGDRGKEANSLITLGNAYNSLGQYQQAIDLHQQSLEIKREISDRKGEAISLNNLGNAYESLGQYQQAIDFHQQSLEIERKISDRKGEAISLNNLGNAYESLGQYQQAIDFYQQSLEIKREIGDRRGEASSFNNLGNAYYSLGQYQRAIDFHQQSLEIKREIGDRNGEATSFNNLGNAYSSLGQYQRAIDFYQQSLEIKREIGDRNGEANSLWNLSNIYQQQGKIRKARECRIEAAKIWQLLNLPIDVIPLPETSKRWYRHLEQQGNDWAELFIQSQEQFGWLMDILAGVSFLISLTVRLFQRFKTSFVFWFVVGLVIVVIIWRLQQ